MRPSFYEIARDYLDPLKRTGIDTLVLGCTHFPLLSASIGQVMGRGVRLISSAEETAHEVAETLAARMQLASDGNVPIHRFATTGDADEFSDVGSRVLRRRIGNAEHIRLAELEAIERARSAARRLRGHGGGGLVRLTVLGSGASFPGSGHACSGYLLESGGTRVMLECGNGSVANAAAVTDVTTLDAVVVSHAHADHFVDLYALQAALRYAPQGPVGSVPLYLPAGLFDMLGCLLTERGRTELGEAYRPHILR